MSFILLTPVTNGKKIELVFISLFVSQMKRCRFYNKLRVSYSLLLFQDEQHANGKESDVRIPKSTGCGANAWEYSEKIVRLRKWKMKFIVKLLFRKREDVCYTIRFEFRKCCKGSRFCEILHVISPPLAVLRCSIKIGVYRHLFACFVVFWLTICAVINTSEISRPLMQQRKMLWQCCIKSSL